MYFKQFNTKLLRQTSAFKSLSTSRSLSNFTCHNLSGHRSLVKVTGQDSAKYLQNLLTNDINLLDRTNEAMYAMILNNRGRVLHDVLVYALGDPVDSGYLVEGDTASLADFLKMLKIYKIKKKVEVTSVDKEFSVYSIFQDSKQHDTPPELVSKENSTNNLPICVTDPRFSQLGYRLIIENKHQPSSYFTNLITENTDYSSYKQHLYKHGIAENHENIVYTNSIPLEYNLVLLNGVSFQKGCYLGQELVAKTHHTGVIRKRIIPIKLECTNVQFKSDSSILNLKTGKVAGKLKGLSGHYGIAMLRLSELSDQLVILDEESNKYSVSYTIPEYWSKDPKLSEMLKN